MNQTKLNKQSWWQLLSIQAGGTICLPVIMVGQLVTQKYGLISAIWGIALGNAFLLAIGLVLASMSAFCPQSTVEHASKYFGKAGRSMFAILMMFSMLGWFGIQTNVMSITLQQLLNKLDLNFSYILLNICMGLLLACIMCIGMNALKGISYIVSPLLGMTLIYAYASSQGIDQAQELLTFSWGGLIFVIGANIAAVIDLPTYFRHASSKKDSMLCILFLYGLIAPLIELVGVYLTAASGGDSIVEVMQGQHSPLWMLWISCFILLSGWTTNNGNLYSTITSSYSIAVSYSYPSRALILGSLGTLIACLNPLGNIEYVLDALGVTIGAMGGVMIAGYFAEVLGFRNDPAVSMFSWMIGLMAGILFTVSIPIIDAFATAFFIQIMINLCMLKRGNYGTVNN